MTEASAFSPPILLAVAISPVATAKTRLMMTTGIRAISGLRKMIRSSTTMRPSVAIMIMESVSPADSIESTAEAACPVMPIDSAPPESCSLASTRICLTDSYTSSVKTFSAEVLTEASMIVPFGESICGPVRTSLISLYFLPVRSAATFETVA